MSCKDRTLVFLNLRNQRKIDRRYGIPLQTKDSIHTKLLDKNVEHEDTDIELGTLRMKHSTIPPGWMSTIDDVNYDISKIKSNMEKLLELHKKHLLPQFNSSMDKDNEEQSVQVMTEYITKMFHDAQTKISRIGGHIVAKQEEPVKKNIQSALALQLQDLSVEFRKRQKDYLQRLRGRQQRGRQIPIDDDSEDDTKFDVGFTPEQTKIAEQASHSQSQRDQDIKDIVKSITELSSIFKDLSILVIEQGTVLDRIDYNIESVSHHVKEGVRELIAVSEFLYFFFVILLRQTIHKKNMERSYVCCYSV